MTLYPNTNIFTKIAFENKVSFKFLLQSWRRKNKRCIVIGLKIIVGVLVKTPPIGMILCFAFLELLSLWKG